MPLKARGLRGLRRIELECLAVAAGKGERVTLTAATIRDLLPMTRRAEALQILKPLWPWPDREAHRWLDVRRRALVYAWASLPRSADSHEIATALVDVAERGRRTALDGVARDRYRLELEGMRRANYRSYRRVLKVADAWNERRILKTLPGGETMTGLQYVIRRHPAVKLAYPDVGPGLLRRDAADPVAALKRATNSRLIAAGLKGRKFTDLRALLLFSTGITRAFDIKMARRLSGDHSFRKIVTRVTATATVRTAVELTQLERAEGLLDKLERR